MEKSKGSPREGSFRPSRGQVNRGSHRGNSAGQRYNTPNPQFFKEEQERNRIENAVNGNSDDLKSEAKKNVESRMQRGGHHQGKRRGGGNYSNPICDGSPKRDVPVKPNEPPTNAWNHKLEVVKPGLCPTSEEEEAEMLTIAMKNSMEDAGMTYETEPSRLEKTSSFPSLNQADLATTSAILNANKVVTPSLDSSAATSTTDVVSNEECGDSLWVKQGARPKNINSSAPKKANNARGKGPPFVDDRRMGSSSNYNFQQEQRQPNAPECQILNGAHSRKRNSYSESKSATDECDSMEVKGANQRLANFDEGYPQEQHRNGHQYRRGGAKSDRRNLQQSFGTGQSSVPKQLLQRPTVAAHPPIEIVKTRPEACDSKQQAVADCQEDAGILPLNGASLGSILETIGVKKVIAGVADRRMDALEPEAVGDCQPNLVELNASGLHDITATVGCGKQDLAEPVVVHKLLATPMPKISDDAKINEPVSDCAMGSSGPPAISTLALTLEAKDAPPGLSNGQPNDISLVAEKTKDEFIRSLQEELAIAKEKNERLEKLLSHLPYGNVAFQCGTPGLMNVFGTPYSIAPNSFPPQSVIPIMNSYSVARPQLALDTGPYQNAGTDNNMEAGEETDAASDAVRRQALLAAAAQNERRHPLPILLHGKNYFTSEPPPSLPAMGMGDTAGSQWNGAQQFGNIMPTDSRLSATADPFVPLIDDASNNGGFPTNFNYPPPIPVSQGQLQLSNAAVTYSNELPMSRAHGAQRGGRYGSINNGYYKRFEAPPSNIAGQPSSYGTENQNFHPASVAQPGTKRCLLGGVGYPGSYQHGQIAGPPFPSNDARFHFQQPNTYNQPQSFPYTPGQPYNSALNGYSPRPRGRGGKMLQSNNGRY